jgi:hypothetical protein
MKTRLIWRNCSLNDFITSFWVECTDEEVTQCILSLVKEKKEEFVEEIKNKRGYSLINKNLNEQVFCNFFLISVDCKFIKSYEWQMPYSGMWNAGNPFREFEVIDFNNLKELKVIQENIRIK